MPDDTPEALTDLIDIGANLTHESFQYDLQQVLDRARSAGVSQILVTGSDVHNSQAGLALARAHPGHLFATAGMHPHLARDMQPAGAGRDLDAVAIGREGRRDFDRFMSDQHGGSALLAQQPKKMNFSRLEKFR